MITRSATARHQGFGKDGRGSVTTQSRTLDEQAYGFGSRFESGAGTNPEELVAAAHAACFTMALSFALAKEGFSQGTLETTAKVELDRDGDGWQISRSDLKLVATVPGMDEEKFGQLARQAETGCPVSKLLNAEIGLEFQLNADASAEPQAV
jgi:osmotically inducible protein OsmC